MKTRFKMHKTIGVICFCLLALVSCTDDLNITPNDDQTVLSENLFEDESAYEQVLAGIYANLALTGTDGPESSNLKDIDAGTSQFGRVLLYTQTLTTDLMVWSYENDAGTRELQRNIWTAQNPLLLGMFSRAHLSVALANNFLRETTDDKLDSRNVSESTRNNIPEYRAEARLMRAMAYYYLMDLFGKANFTDENTPLNTQPEVYERAQLFSFIEAELLDIEDDLVAPRQNEYGRADSAVAQMILAKIYLNAEVYISENRYSDCMNYCEKIIGGGYELADSYLHNFMADNNTNSATKEIIFPIVSDGVTTQNYGPTTVMVNGSVGSLEKNGDEVGVGTEGWGGALRIKRQFAELFGAAFANDDRNTVISADRPIDIPDISDRDTGYVIQKYSNATSTGGFGADKTFVDTDFPLYRLADVYLMYAEAHLRGGGGNLTTAVEYINALRTRANNPSSISSGDLTLDFILDERARELHWEAHRRQDLIRYSRYTGGNYNWAWKGNGSNGIAIPSHFDVFPIPTGSIAANPDNLKQNTGY
ncbi:RagB/SusD family nutrient uptake outer membrane protein [Hyunsoonleella pacifica]|uniref:RagB/SusD family nutrient uptake outer membrane protein n=1 Tax=Hyunsoonleella pacifica TaxID=1080224 RepID=A0A4Q9FL56_9FLAO|nr:RagB/SusD family nutrient uptake outer membrane protein [Hyunsoonleella pacifica]TBN14531.1 RagB/SusD family nutrient uptake outer membrane protein [Hyunsoonleella pacifica]GGD14561.1 outer membrane protein [Hyunsoonleella pacifica]